MSPAPPQFGPYELVDRLGVGGMAETYVAIRRGVGGFEQRVCLKRILPAFERDPNFIRLFMREARVSARLRHSNIAQVVDFGLVGESHFLALELIEGMDLRKLLRSLATQGQKLEVGLAIHLAYELANALDFAHAADSTGKPSGVVHRDISSSNVLVSRAGEIKLTDFGIAKAVSQVATIQSGTIKGKVPYMAPEYATSGHFDARSDLFSFGVVLYECLAGRRPFDAKTDIETLKRIINEDYVRLADLELEASPTFVRAIDRLLHADPTKRFANASHFLDALAGTTPPPTARQSLGKLVRFHCAQLESAPTPQEETRHLSPPGGTIALPDTSELEAKTTTGTRPSSSPEADTRTQSPQVKAKPE